MPDTMSCLPMVNDRGATEGSKYFEWGGRPMSYLSQNTCKRLIRSSVSPLHFMVSVWQSLGAKALFRALLIGRLTGIAILN